MTAFTRWMWHKTYQTFYCFTSRLYLESECDDLSSDLCNLPITFELPSSEYDISRSHLIHRRQLLRWRHSRDECGTKHIRHSLAFPWDYTSSQNAMDLVQTYGTRAATELMHDLRRKNPLRFPLLCSFFHFFVHPSGPRLELELIQTQMTQKPMLRAEVYARALRASQNRKEDSL